MNSIYILGNELNGLEFVTYMIIPTSIFLVVLIYIYFNIKLIKLSFDFDITSLKQLDLKNDKELDKLRKKISIERNMEDIQAEYTGK